MHVGRLCRCLRRQVGKSAAEATEFCCRQEWRVFLAIASDSGQGSTYEKEQQRLMGEIQQGHGLTFRGNDEAVILRSPNLEK